MGLGAVPQLSVAATIAVSPGGVAETEVKYSAAPGEANRVVVSYAAGGVRVADAGAIIRASAPCVLVNPHVADCPGDLPVNVASGDLDDEIRSEGSDPLRVLPAPQLSANGGIGDDTLVGAPGVLAVLNGGGGGHDKLLGGGIASLRDGDTPGVADADVMEGGRVSYSNRSAPVYVDLGDSSPDGELGEGDVLRGIFRVVGGSGPDELRAGNGLNRLSGGGGADRLDGRGATGPDGARLQGGDASDTLIGSPHADRIDGGHGSDRVRGGAGDDAVALTRDRPDHVACDRGTDTVQAPRTHDPGPDIVRGPGAGDFIAPTCETLLYETDDFIGIEVTPYPLRRDRDSVTFRVRCPRRLPFEGAMRMRERFSRLRLLGGRTLRPRDCDDRRRAELDLALTRVGRRLASRPMGVRTTITLRVRDFVALRWTIDLARPSRSLDLDAAPRR
jgi:Ca2+-binding RTX toxin-like protein